MSDFNHTPGASSFQTSLQSGYGRNVGAGSGGTPIGGEGHPEGISHFEGPLGQKLGMTEGDVKNSIDSTMSGSYFDKALSAGLFQMNIFNSLLGGAVEQLSPVNALNLGSTPILPRLSNHGILSLTGGKGGQGR